MKLRKWDKKTNQTRRPAEATVEDAIQHAKGKDQVAILIMAVKRNLIHEGGMRLQRFTPSFCDRRIKREPEGEGWDPKDMKRGSCKSS